jgi:arylsulfatase A-like enzyme
VIKSKRAFVNVHALRSAACALAALATSIACGDAPLPAASPPRYNHVLPVTIDTLRADHLSCYGYPRPTSPFICSLAERGVLFKRGMSSASHTAPSHATMLTGLYPYQHGVRLNGENLSADVSNIVGAAHERGYRTGGFASAGFARHMAKEIFDEMDGVKLRSARDTVSAAIEWLDDVGDHPTFLWVHLFDVHEWDQTPQGYEEFLEPILAAGPNGDDLYPHLARTHGFGEQSRFEPLRGSPQEAVQWTNIYDALIRSVDQQVKRLFSVVEKRGGDALWIVTADHGEGLGSHGYEDHGKHLYQEQISVPLLFYASDGVGAGRVVDELVHHVDLRPTLTEWLGLPLAPAGDEVEARSLMPLLEDRPWSGERVLLSQRRPAKRKKDPEEVGEDVFVLREDNYKYIFHSHEGHEFYDLSSDTVELNNLISVESEAKDRLSSRALAIYPRLRTHRSKEIPEELQEELRALGYIE